MFKKSVFKIGKNKFTGFTIKLQKANIVLITARKGYVMCGYLNLKIPDRLNEAACIVTGVKKPEDILSKKVEYVSKAAKLLGIKKGISAKKALAKLS
ncbi:MAG: DUF1805 domain-containing protein [Candidatus Omnitrophica bacterium]|nr:DUF1805 domain-containing protein [Candidatus Omnitrophota bacterium]MDD5351675.1 DUF1805 domain-containing protein [Candidatus Omnitrophota bacterium]MDD5550885.1 DUF1805 domain-containing protein [Candidatus Omnitrophota bacterium]